jgi:hypothetical protein
VQVFIIRTPPARLRRDSEGVQPHSVIGVDADRADAGAGYPQGFPE